MTNPKTKPGDLPFPDPSPTESDDLMDEPTEDPAPESEGVDSPDEPRVPTGAPPEVDRL